MSEELKEPIKSIVERILNGDIKPHYTYMPMASSYHVTDSATGLDIFVTSVGCGCNWISPRENNAILNACDYAKQAEENKERNEMIKRYSELKEAIK